MAKDTGKVQVYGTTDGFLNWRKRDGSGDIVAHDGTKHGSVASAIKAAAAANPGADRIEVLLDDNGQGVYQVPWSHEDYPA